MTMSHNSFILSLKFILNHIYKMSILNPHVIAWKLDDVARSIKKYNLRVLQVIGDPDTMNFMVNGKCEMTFRIYADDWLSVYRNNSRVAEFQVHNIHKIMNDNNYITEDERRLMIEALKCIYSVMCL